MTREDYISAVKVKLDEISPFDEPADFIASEGDATYKEVKPIVSYIEENLDKAALFCLNSLPMSLLAEDVDNDTMAVSIDSMGVGHIKDVYDYYRLVRVDCGKFERSITAFITSSSPNYLLQQNKYTRGGLAKPVASYTPEKAEIELFSFPVALENTSIKAIVYYVDAHKAAEQIHSAISNFVVLMTAIYVQRILGDDSIRLENEYQEHLATILA